jgi:hypothetical protein
MVVADKVTQGQGSAMVVSQKFINYFRGFIWCHHARILLRAGSPSLRLRPVD